MSFSLDLSESEKTQLTLLATGQAIGDLEIIDPIRGHIIIWLFPVGPFPHTKGLLQIKKHGSLTRNLIP